MSRIFVSHSSRDDAAANALVQWLFEQGWDDVFLDFSPEAGIAAGANWASALRDAGARCQAVIFVISRNWLASEECRKELAVAAHERKKLFGVTIEDGIALGDMPRELRDTQLTNLASGAEMRVFSSAYRDGKQAENSFSTIGLRALRNGLRHAGLDAHFFAWPPSSDPNRSPYRGLKPLETSDAGIFFGREAPTSEAIEVLRGLIQKPAPGFLAILAASGSGKSSFLRAGLLPRLTRNDETFLPLPVLRPERAALYGPAGLLPALEGAYAAAGLQATRAELRADIEIGGERLISRFSALTSVPNRPSLVLAIDQAEEAVSADAGAEGEGLLVRLRALADTPSFKLVVIFTIRTDAFERLQVAPALEGAPVTTFNLPPMPRGAYQTLIEGPATRYSLAGRSLPIDPQLTGALLADLDRGGAKDTLPLLAFALERLFAEHGAMSFGAYQAMGGITGAIDAAVAEAFRSADADPAVPRDIGSRLALLRRGLIPWLAGFDPTTGRPRRRVARWSDIPTESQPLMRHLVEQRLLTTDINPATGEATVEPAHETLLSAWNTLNGWLREDAPLLSVLDAVQQAARDWVSNARDAVYLVHTAGRLAGAEMLMDRADLAADLGQQGRDYLAACRAAETERVEKELAKARTLAEAQTLAAERQRLVARRTRLGLIGAVVLTAVAIAFAALGLWQATVADQQRELAEAQRLIADQRAVEAEEQRAIAVAAQELAAERLDAAVEAQTEAARQAEIASTNEGRAVIALARNALLQKRPVDALKLALVASPKGEGQPVLPDAMDIVSATLSGFNLPLRQAQYAPSGEASGTTMNAALTRLVEWREDGTLRLFDAETGKQVGAAMRHEGPINGAFLIEDDGTLLSYSNDGTIRAWNALTGELAQPPFELGEPVAYVQLSADGQRIFARGASGSMAFWDLVTGLPIGPRFQHPGALSYSFDVDAEQSRVISWTEAGELAVWHMTSGLPVGTSASSGKAINSASADKAKHWVAAYSYNSGTVDLWDASRSPPVFYELQTGYEDISEAQVSEDGRRVLVHKYDQDIALLWTTISPDSPPLRLVHDGPVDGAALSADGERVLTWSGRMLRVWDAGSGTQLVPDMAHGSTIYFASLFADGTRALAWSEDNQAQIWDLETGKQVGPTMVTDGAIDWAYLIVSETRVLTYSSESGAFQLWDAATALPTGQPLYHGSDLSWVYVNEAGTRALSTGSDGASSIWSVARGAFVGAPMPFDPFAYTVRLTPDQQRIILWSSGLELAFWDANTGTRLGPDEKIASQRAWVQFNSAGTRLAAWLIEDDIASATDVSLWDTENGAVIADLSEPEIAIGVIFGEKPETLLTWSGDGTIFRWNALTGERVGGPIETDDELVSFWLTKGDEMLLTSTIDKIVSWDVASGARLGEFPTSAPTSGIMMDGRSRMLVLDEDGILTLWDLVSGDTIATPLAGQTFASGGIVGTIGFAYTLAGDVVLWDVPTGRMIRSFNDGPISKFVTSSDDVHFLTYSNSHDIPAQDDSFEHGSMRLYSATTGESIGEGMKHDGDITGTYFTPAGDRIVSWSIYDDTVRIWDVATGSQIGPSLNQPSAAGAYLFGDGRRLASWGGPYSEGGSVRLWDLESNSMILPPVPFEDSVSGFVPFADERRAIAWTSSGVGLRIIDIDLPQGNAIAVACELLPDHDLSDISLHYGITITEPICAPEQLVVPTGWDR